MFESRYVFEPTAYALNRASLDRTTTACGAAFRKAKVPQPK
jgi:hypothetical protein